MTTSSIQRVKSAFAFRLSDVGNIDLNGSYRQNSEFLKLDDKTIPNIKVETTKHQSQFLTWDTLKKIRRQKSCKIPSDLKRYQSSVCLVETSSIQQNQRHLPSSESERQFQSLDPFLKYADRYRSSPTLRSGHFQNIPNNFYDHARQERRDNDSFTFSRKLSVSALKFTG